MSEQQRAYAEKIRLVLIYLMSQCTKYYIIRRTGYGVVIFLILCLDVFLLLPINTVVYRDSYGSISTGDWWTAFFKTTVIVAVFILVEAALWRLWLRSLERWVGQRDLIGRSASLCLNIGFISVFGLTLYYLYHLGVAASLPSLDLATQIRFSELDAQGHVVVSDTGLEWRSSAEWIKFSLIFSSLAGAYCLIQFQLLNKDQKDYDWHVEAHQKAEQSLREHEYAIAAQNRLAYAEKACVAHKLRLRSELYDAIQSGLLWFEEKMFALRHGYQPKAVEDDPYGHLKFLEKVLYLRGEGELVKRLDTARQKLETLNFFDSADIKNEDDSGGVQ